MKLWYDKRSRDPIYYIQQGIRNGNKVTSKNIRRIGKHSELLQITEDPLAYAKAEVEKMNRETRNYKAFSGNAINLNQRVRKSGRNYSRPLEANIGYLFLQHMIHEMKLSSIFTEMSKNQELDRKQYDLWRFRVCSQAMSSQTDSEKWSLPETYFETPESSPELEQLLSENLWNHYNDYVAYLYQKRNQIMNAVSGRLYYHCKDYAFYTAEKEPSIRDACTGEIIPGMDFFADRNTKQFVPPLVEMGLITDSRGMPASICLLPGQLETQATPMPLEHELMTQAARNGFVYVADSECGPYHLKRFLQMGGKHYVISLAVSEINRILQDVFFEDADFRMLKSGEPVTLEKLKNFDPRLPEEQDLYNDLAYKLIDIENPLIAMKLYRDKDPDPREEDYKPLIDPKHQKVIVTFSRKMLEYQKATRSLNIERARDLLALNLPEEIGQSPETIRHYIRTLSVPLSPVSIRTSYLLNRGLIQNESRYDGFQIIATNLDEPPENILEISRNRVQYTARFGKLKTGFFNRPEDLKNPLKLSSHFLTCFTAALIIRMLTEKLQAQEATLSGPEGMTEENLLLTLRSMAVANLDDREYLALYDSSRMLEALIRTTGLILDRIHYTPRELNQLIRKCR